jgi:NAD(P)-dependent dehydrogenase (short-subunit alcohol dehydrogenase family)
MQTVVVTGASAGIGRATARLFGQRGARVVLIARGQAGLDGAARDVREAGGQALAISADVADYDQVAAAARKAEEQFGPIDVWVNVAFTSVFAPFSDITAEEFRRVTEVSYLGFVHGTMAALALTPPRPGHHRAGRIGARRTQHPAAVRLLRGQARHQRIHLLAPLRAAARELRRAGHRGPDASGQHAAVLLG